jgi:hypothetical protein
MSKLYITEYQEMASHYAQAPQEPCIVDQTPVVIGAGSLKSAAFNAKTHVVRIHADAICSIAFGEDPTATTDSQRFAAGQTEFRVVGPGQKVAVIGNT